MRGPAVVVATVLVAATGLAACGSDKETAGIVRSTTAPATTPTRTGPLVLPRSTKDGCKPVALPEPRREKVARPRRGLHLRDRYVATVLTNCGAIQIKLDVRNFPKTARSFVGLVRAGFYDGLSFHQIARPGGNDFLIQAGDPLGTGDGGPGFSVREKVPEDTFYPRLTVAMAKAQDEKAGTSGSQFFIVTGDGSGLQPLYAKVGRVIHGGRIVRRIARIPADPVTEAPNDAVVIKTMTVKESRP